MGIDNKKAILQNNFSAKEAAPEPARRRGPKTRKGRAAVGLNARTHGITSNAPVIPLMESEDEWDDHAAGVAASLQPEGYLEVVLAERIANVFWRLRRITRYETAAIMNHIAETVEDMVIAVNYSAGTLGTDKLIVPDEAEVHAAQRNRSLPPSSDMEKIMRYETHFHRQLVQLLHEFEALQARRRGESAPLARLDVSVAPAP